MQTFITKYKYPLLGQTIDPKIVLLSSHVHARAAMLAVLHHRIFTLQKFTL